MNILYICDEYPPGRHGGIGTSVQLLARQMAKMGHTVIVAGFCDWGYGGPDFFEDQGVKVYRFRRALNSSFFSKKDKLWVRATYKAFNILGIFQQDIAYSLKKYKVFVEGLIEKYAIDVIETPDFNEYVQYCKKYTPFPRFSRPTLIKLNGSLTYFLREEGKPVPPHIQQMDEQTLRQADGVAGVSRYTATQTAKYLNYNRPIEVIQNGIEIPQRKGNMLKDERLVVFTGSLVRKKGIYQLMKAWNIVHHRMPDARLEVYGKGPIKDIREELVGEAAYTVSFMGHVSRAELLGKLEQTAVAVFPSYAEAFALAPLEAMACGTVVANSNRTSGPELVADGLNGVLVDPDDVEGMAKKLLYLLQNPEEAKRMASLGKKTVEEQFAIGIIAEKNIVYYEQIIKNSPLL